MKHRDAAERGAAAETHEDGILVTRTGVDGVAVLKPACQLVNGFGGNGGGFVGADVQRGFDQSAVMAGINNLTSDVCNGFAGVNQNMCNGFAGVQNGFAQAEIANNSRQMANMNQIYGLQSQFADCCCENRLGTADLKYTIATENCADRQALNEGVRDIIANQTAGTQRILDKLCDQELYAERRENEQLRQQLNFANLQTSQVAQTAELRQSGATQLNQLVSELRSCPIPAQPVYGSTPIFTCNNNGCGCGTGCSCGSF